MTFGAERCGWVLQGQIVSGEGFRKDDYCEVWTEKLSQWRGSPHVTVGDFVAAKAPNFNRVQSTSTSGCKRFNRNRLRTTEIHRFQ
jgi:hypothetical protein